MKAWKMSALRGERAPAPRAGATRARQSRRERRRRAGETPPGARAAPPSRGRAERHSSCWRRADGVLAVWARESVERRARRNASRRASSACAEPRRRLFAQERGVEVPVHASCATPRTPAASPVSRWRPSMSLSRFVCVDAWLISQPPASLSAGGRRSAHTAPRPRERRARASPQTLFTVCYDTATGLALIL
jgi:hypothetical protein